MAFCKIFGYTKKELVGRNIKTLMPKLISEHHDKFVLKNLDRIKISCCSTIEHDIATFGLHQSKYIFPMAIKLQSAPNLLNDMQYIAKIKTDKKYSSNKVAFVILNKKKEVVEITSSCISMLNISIATLSNYTIDMTTIAPDLVRKEKVQSYLQKGGGRIKIYHPTAEHRQRIFSINITLNRC